MIFLSLDTRLRFLPPSFSFLRRTTTPEDSAMLGLIASCSFLLRAGRAAWASSIDATGAVPSRA